MFSRCFPIKLFFPPKSQILKNLKPGIVSLCFLFWLKTNRKKAEGTQTLLSEVFWWGTEARRSAGSGALVRAGRERRRRRRGPCGAAARARGQAAAPTWAHAAKARPRSLDLPSMRPWPGPSEAAPGIVAAVEDHG